MPSPAPAESAAGVVVDLAKARSRHWSDMIEAVASRGDPAAYDRIYRHFAPRLRLRGICRGLTPAIADDVVQETMLSVWQHAGQYRRARGAASTWIYTIFRNKCIDAVRRQPPHEIDIEAVRETARSEVIDGNHPDAQVLGEASLGRALATLTAEQRKVVDKAFFEDKSHHEIALELRLPLGTVKSRIRLGLSRLKAGLSL
jgi:RNA polymerase sigma-70 factor (ECF subfamily)